MLETVLYLSRCTQGDYKEQLVTEQSVEDEIAAFEAELEAELGE